MDFETVRDMIAEQLKVDASEIKPESRLRKPADGRPEG